jgi:MocE subfamily Rieske [2Fe-2S] domain protein
MHTTSGCAWVKATEVTELDEDDAVTVEIAGCVLAVYRTGKGFFASDGTCTHEFALLADGFVHGAVVECPKHQGRFDLRTGEAKAPPATAGLRTYPVRIVDGDVEVCLDQSAP